MGTTVELDDLPEPIIQHILSFLTAKEAAQTTLLSNSWRSAWLTRPNLVFEKGSSNYLAQTIQRYEESNLKIQSLTLRVPDFWDDDDNELIGKSLKLGATQLYLDLPSFFVLPHDIVFGSEKLVGLSVGWCKIEIGSSERKVIRCSGLESLSLSFTDISPDSLSNIISSCPSIRKLSLSYIDGVIRSVGLGPINLHSLTRLKLVYVEFDTLFLGDMSSRFPSLKDLTLHTLYTSSQDKEIRISSRSLERLNFSKEKQDRRRREKRVRFKFDVPRIRRFTYEGRIIPLLSFESTSTEWESRVYIERHKNLDSLWFRRLNKFLTKLRKSRIHLSLDVRSRASFDYEAGEIQGLRKRPQVENLTVDVRSLPYLSCYALFDGLFQLCRPKFITQNLHPGSRVKSEYFLCKAFLARPGGNASDFLYYGLRDLEEVNVELFDKEVAVWMHVPLKSLLDIDASTSWATDEEKIRFYDDSTSWATDEDEEENRFEQKIRFQLKWKRKTHGAFC